MPCTIVVGERCTGKTTYIKKNIPQQNTIVVCECSEDVGNWKGYQKKTIPEILAMDNDFKTVVIEDCLDKELINQLYSWSVRNPNIYVMISTQYTGDISGVVRKGSSIFALKK